MDTDSTRGSSQCLLKDAETLNVGASQGRGGLEEGASAVDLASFGPESQSPPPHPPPPRYHAQTDPRRTTARLSLGAGRRGVLGEIQRWPAAGTSGQ
jgi:hypothetical protein